MMVVCLERILQLSTATTGMQLDEKELESCVIVIDGYLNKQTMQAILLNLKSSDGFSFLYFIRDIVIRLRFGSNATNNNNIYKLMEKLVPRPYAYETNSKDFRRNIQLGLYDVSRLLRDCVVDRVDVLNLKRDDIEAIFQGIPCKEVIKNARFPEDEKLVEYFLEDGIDNLLNGSNDDELYSCALSFIESRIVAFSRRVREKCEEDRVLDRVLDRGPPIDWVRIREREKFELKVLDLLEKTKVDINKVKGNGETILHTLLKWHNLSISQVKFLVEKCGARLTREMIQTSQPHYRDYLVKTMRMINQRAATTLLVLKRFRLFPTSIDKCVDRDVVRMIARMTCHSAPILFNAPYIMPSETSRIRKKP